MRLSTPHLTKLAEALPDLPISAFKEVMEVAFCVASCPRLNNETDDQFDVVTLKDLMERSELIVSAMIEKGVIE